MFGKCGGKSTGKHPCTRQDLTAAKRQRDVALRGLETAQSGLEAAQDLTAYLQKQLLELEDSSSAKAKEAETKLEKAKQELKDAKKELQEAKKELKEAEQKYEAKASVQAGREQAGASAYAVVAVAFGLQRSRMVVVRFRAVQPFLLFGVMLSSQQGFRSSLSRFHCVGLQHFGEWHVLRSLCALQVAVVFV